MSLTKQISLLFATDIDTSSEKLLIDYYVAERHFALVLEITSISLKKILSIYFMQHTVDRKEDVAYTYTHVTVAYTESMTTY